METEPYNLQSPEQIAKDYGGNKQRIAEAMQMGLLDPTAGTLAGMFIDRMRNAAQAEAAPQQSVAQQVFAPPMPVAPGAGLAGTPQAAAMQGQMPPIPGGAPGGAPMGPPPAGLAAAPMPAPGMAAGGLTTLPLPNDMFDEPGNGDYRGGGLVAFAAGSPGELVDDEEEDRSVSETGTRPQDMIVVGARPRDTEILEDQYGYRPDFFGNLDLMKEAAPVERTQRDRLTQFIERQLTPEAQRARRQEDMWMALGQIGARMATTPGSLLQAASTGISEALPGIREAAAARRSEERADLATLAQQEGLSNREAREYAQLAATATNQYGQFDLARLNREQAERFKELDLQIERARIAAQRYGYELGYRGQVRSAEIGAAGQATFMDKQLAQAERQARLAAREELQALRMDRSNPIGAAYSAYRANPTRDNQAAYEAAERAYVDNAAALVTGNYGGAGGNVTRYDNQGNPIP